MADYKNFGYILKDWMPIVNEYAKFLNRYGFDTIIVLLKTNSYGIYEAKLFADENKYLKFVTENSHFIAEEKQIKELLDYIKVLIHTDIIDDKDDYID